MLLKKGSRGEEVKQLQKALGVGADGIFGSGTEAVVKKFQKDNGLAVDGLVGPGTWEAIGIDTDSFETASEIKDFADDIMGEMVYGGDDPAFLIGEFKKPVFKNEVLEQFPDVNIDELNSLTDKLF